ncbi:hypothetical protein SAMN05443667_11461 [Flavobacterium gillisiae]|uniref:Uncharacterized protein n=2 Tax=Flavobacterium gillisiae TaxID=150146 RepID=A0A1H4FQX0_9FLAO|nr:hypothetical protein SAMN05443667_11461 [Flavobacterium gillisiae]
MLAFVRVLKQKVMNRNSKKIVKQDIKFIEEMIFNLELGKTDIVSQEHLKLMMNDWKNELEKFILKPKS